MVKVFWNNKIQGASAEELRKLQLRLLRRQVKRVYEKSIFYRRKFREAGVKPSQIKSLEDVTARWGGPFEVRFEEDWLRFITNWKKKGHIVVHLTMYGINLPTIIKDIRVAYSRGADLLVVVGAEKVPRVVYEMADYNVAVSNQPHSEVAALAVFLDWLFEGRELLKRFKNAKIQIVPTLHGKKIIVRDST